MRQRSRTSAQWHVQTERTEPDANRQSSESCYSGPVSLSERDHRWCNNVVLSMFVDEYSVPLHSNYCLLLLLLSLCLFVCGSLSLSFLTCCSCSFTQGVGVSRSLLPTSLFEHLLLVRARNPSTQKTTIAVLSVLSCLFGRVTITCVLSPKRMGCVHRKCSKVWRLHIPANFVQLLRTAHH